jgi:hypothetical protein
VRTRLRERFGISVKVIEDTAIAWASAEAGAPAFGPTNGGGTLGYIQGTAKFREDLKLAGYEKLDPKGSPIAVSKALGITFAVTKGDNVTGLDMGPLQPTTKNELGSIRTEGVETNARQGDLFEWASRSRIASPGHGVVQETKKEDAPSTLWLLLIYLDLESGTLRAEVSCPLSLDLSRANHWSERILIPEFEWRKPKDSSDSEDAAQHGKEFDVLVERIA